ncbi:MAG: hypothetical protein RH917_08350 [Lacipirellulaceae bacterium]
MKHFALPRFWRLYHQLPPEIQKLADKNFALLKENSSHPSLQFKKITGKHELWSARVGLNYRVLGRDHPEGVAWFWIGPHAEYDRVIS